MKERLLLALQEGNTDKVFELSKQGASLNGYILIGFSNPHGEWSNNVFSAAKNFSKNTNVFVLPIGMAHVENDEFVKNFSGFINPGSTDAFPRETAFTLKDLPREKMIVNEILYQQVLNVCNKYRIPYLGICAGSQHLVLNNEGSLHLTPGYQGDDHRADFLYGTIPYFMTLTEKEQELAFAKCIYPEVFFPIQTRHKYTAIDNQLGRVTLGAIYEDGTVGAHSVGVTKIGVQFHPENYYFETELGKVNRQKQFIDNFLNLCINHHRLSQYAKDHQISQNQFLARMELYDLAVIARLKACSERGISPVEPPQEQILLPLVQATCNEEQPSQEIYQYNIFENKIEHIIKYIVDKGLDLEKFRMYGYLNKEQREIFLLLSKQEHLIPIFKEYQSALEEKNKLKIESILDILQENNVLEYGFIMACQNDEAQLAIEKIFPHMANKALISFLDKTQQKEISKYMRVEQLHEFIGSFYSQDVIIPKIEELLKQKNIIEAEKYISILSDKSVLAEAANLLIQHNNLNILLKILPKLAQRNLLNDVAIKVIDQNEIKFFEDNFLANISNDNLITISVKLIEKGEINFFKDKLLSKIPNNDLGDISVKLIEKNEVHFFTDSLLPRVPEYILLNIAVELIEKNIIEFVKYNLVPILKEYQLQSVILALIEKGEIEFVKDKLLSEMSEQNLSNLALELIKKNKIEFVKDNLLTRLKEWYLDYVILKLIEIREIQFIKDNLILILKGYYLDRVLLKLVQIGEIDFVKDKLLPNIPEDTLGRIVSELINGNETEFLKNYLVPILKGFYLNIVILKLVEIGDIEFVKDKILPRISEGDLYNIAFQLIRKNIIQFVKDNIVPRLEGYNLEFVLLDLVGVGEIEFVKNRVLPNIGSRFHEKIINKCIEKYPTVFYQSLSNAEIESYSTQYDKFATWAKGIAALNSKSILSSVASGVDSVVQSIIPTLPIVAAETVEKKSELNKVTSSFSPFVKPESLPSLQLAIVLPKVIENTSAVICDLIGEIFSKKAASEDVAAIQTTLKQELLDFNSVLDVIQVKIVSMKERIIKRINHLTTEVDIELIKHIKEKYDINSIEYLTQEQIRIIKEDPQGKKIFKKYETKVAALNNKLNNIVNPLNDKLIDMKFSLLDIKSQMQPLINKSENISVYTLEKIKESHEDLKLKMKIFDPLLRSDYTASIIVTTVAANATLFRNNNLSITTEFTDTSPSNKVQDADEIIGSTTLKQNSDTHKSKR